MIDKSFKKKRVILSCVLLFFILWVVGCIMEKSSDELTPSDIINRTLEKSRDVKTYKLEHVSRTSSIMMVGEGKTTQTWNYSADSIWSYTVDLEHRKIALHMQILANNSTVDGWMYLFDGAHYTFVEAENRWERTPLSEREFELGWESFERFNSAILTLKFVNATYLGVEEVEGVECYAFGWNETRVEEEEIAKAEQISRSESEIENRLWIDKSFFFKKFETRIVINFKIEGNRSVMRNEGIMEYGTKFFDFNKPVNIVLPRDPEEAVEIPLPPMILRGWESMQEARQKALEKLNRTGVGS